MGGPVGGEVRGLRAAETLVRTAGVHPCIAPAPIPALPDAPSRACTGGRARGPSPGPARPADVAQTAQAAGPSGTQQLLPGSQGVSRAAPQAAFNRNHFGKKSRTALFPKCQDVLSKSFCQDSDLGGSFDLSCEPALFGTLVLPEHCLNH